ncbi:hypothetical protein DPMN_017965 [Dreissena polymorpha]|uniref:Uncharacterized protein n=1 Tax=Dreissena polymorpha TaxID=45954 RepID=A0A9D4NFV0_DREPO|nr:hypothetical protein DPMN_017965 [Dreissena polymorpha]
MSLEETSKDITEKVCVICKEQDDRPVSKLGEKGCQGLSLAAKNYTDQIIEFVPGQFVHIDCRKKYCHPNKTSSRGKTASNLMSSPKIRQSTNGNTFDFGTKCLFCGSDAKFCHGKRGIDVNPVMTLEFELTIRESCKSRCD